MMVDIKILQLVISIISVLGIGGILKYLLSIEHRITAIETRVSVIMLRRTDRVGKLEPPRDKGGNV